MAKKKRVQRVRKVLDTTIFKTFDPPPGFPSTVRIRGTVFRVIYAHPLVDGETNYLGLVKYEERTIYVDPCNDPHRVRETLLHEIAHVYFHETDAPGGALLETICDLFASGWCDLIDNNGKI